MNYKLRREFMCCLHNLTKSDFLWFSSQEKQIKSSIFSKQNAFLFVRLGAQRHSTCVNLTAVPVWRLDGQIAADLESLVWLLNSGAGRDPSAHWTPSSQPAHICKRPRLTGQTDQRGFVGLELSTGRREDCQDRTRESGAWKHTQDIHQLPRKQIIDTKHDRNRLYY